MKLLHCATCGTYTRKANFDIATRHPGRLEVQEGAIVARLGGRNLPEFVPLAGIQRAFCMVCDEQLAVEEMDVCPHESDDRYWIDKSGDKAPVRVCELCGYRQVGTYVPVWPVG